MILFKEAYATVWATDPQEKFIKGRITTSEKKQDGEGFINSTWFARFVGKAKDKATGLKEKDRIKITSGKITNTSYEKDGQKLTYLNVTIFDYELVSSGNANASSTNTNSKPNTNVQYSEDDEEMPF